MRKVEIVTAYTLTLTAACAGLLAAPIWTFLICGSLLGLMAIWEQHKFKSRFAALGADGILSSAQLASFADGCLVAAAAWTVGFGFRAAVLLAS